MDAFLLTVMIAGGLVLAVALLAIVVSLVESSGRRKRLRQLQELREGPSALRLPKPPSAPPPRAFTPQLPALEIPFDSPAPPSPRAAPAKPTEEISSFRPVSSAFDDLPLSSVEAEPPAKPAAFTPTTRSYSPKQTLSFFPDDNDNSLSALTSPGQRATPIERAVEPTLDEPRHDFGLSASAPIPATPKALASESKSILYLDPDFELAEVKRVLRIWQMTPSASENLPPNQMGRWLCEDGTLVELLVGEKGYPYLDIRGPMANDLARYLPQDLPIRPDLASLAEMS